MNIEQSAFGGEHGSIQVTPDEPKTSNDGTLNQIQLIDSTFFSTEQDVRYDEQSNGDLKFVMHKEKTKVYT